jgi:hypothetical protein
VSLAPAGDARFAETTGRDHGKVSTCEPWSLPLLIVMDILQDLFRPLHDRDKECHNREAHAAEEEHQHLNGYGITVENEGEEGNDV